MNCVNGFALEAILQFYEHIFTLLHLESLTTTRLGVWLPTSCMLCAHERFPENDEPPKIYSNGNIFFLLLCNITRMNDRRNLIVDAIISSSVSRTTYNVANTT